MSSRTSETCEFASSISMLDTPEPVCAWRGVVVTMPLVPPRATPHSLSYGIHCKIPSLPSKQPVSIVVVHATGLRTVAMPASGRLVATALIQGMLLRVYGLGRVNREAGPQVPIALRWRTFRQTSRSGVCASGPVHVFKCITSRIM